MHAHCLGAQSVSQALTPSAQTRESFLKKLPEKPTQLALVWTITTISFSNATTFKAIQGM